MASSHLSFLRLSLFSINFFFFFLSISLLCLSPIHSIFDFFFSHSSPFLSQLSLSLPSSISIWFFFSLSLFFVSFLVVFGWFESVVIGFKVVGCFSGGDRVMGHGGDRVWLGFWVSVGVSMVICWGGLLWRRWVGLGLCFGGVVATLGYGFPVISLKTGLNRTGP